MLLKTSTVTAPWTVVEGDDKYYARVKILKTLVEKMSTELNYDPYAKNRSNPTDKSKANKKKDKN